MIEFKASVTPAEGRRLEEFIAVLRRACVADVNRESWLADEAFESEFRSRLLVQHCFMGSPLFQESFESAFLAACQCAGHEVEPAPPGQRFWDALVDGRRVSLKSSKARDLKEGTLHISKLTEASWIQDCRTATARRKRTCQLFSEYCHEVEIIFQLRYFGSRHVYELVEIPVSMFAQVQDLGNAQFVAEGTRVNIPVGKEPPDFTLVLDRSDAKVTIANINKDECLVHATWQL